MNLTPQKAPTIKIIGDNGRTLLVLDRHEGKLTAEYDPADLDEAAQKFVQEVTRIADQPDV